MTRHTCVVKTLGIELTLTFALLGFSACDTDDTAGTASAKSPQAESKPEIGSWGFDLAGMDEMTKPGDSFFTYANGSWLGAHEIPADRTSWGSFQMLAVKSEEQLHDLIEHLPEDAPSGSSAQKVRDYYSAYLDTSAIEAKGLEPARDGLDAIAAATDHKAIIELMARPELGLLAPISVGVTIDEKQPDRYIAAVGQSGLGLPDREYYLADSPAYAELRAEYKAHIARVFSLIGQSNADAEAGSVLALETQIAQRHWPVAKRRERELTYNLRKREQLSEESGDFPWDTLLTAAGLAGEEEFVIAELDAVQAIARFFRSVPLETWAAYCRYHYVIAHASLLPEAFDSENFDFYGRTLNGQKEPRARWRRAIAATNGGLGEAVGELYVAEHFPARNKQLMLKLVEDLRSAYSTRIQDLKWMSESTKQAAQRKLKTFRPKIGYPDKWKDYSALEVRAGDAFGNATRAAVWSWLDDLAHLGRPTDRDEWFMTPQTVNAYYNSVFNEIVFPAAILQPPFFDPNADPALNYGAIGGVIGHEMGHGFDDQGAKSDESGVLRTWWQPEDEEAFGQLVDKLVAQYDAYEPLPGLHINGQLTVGENIGDLGGLTVAYAAYRASLKGAQAPVLDGLTGDQRFFLGWAQVWRQLVRDESLRNQLMSDPHSPAAFRVNGVVRNVDAWYEAFDVKADDPLWLAPEERVHIW